MELGASYDALPYEALPYVQTHPERLHTIAALFGLEPAAVGKCRVLEVGCSTGGNLLAMADAAPGSEFVGIDLSGHQIELAKALAEECKIANAQFEAIDLCDFPQGFGEFDYIVAHGVYSWMPQEARDALVRLCATHLSPNGIGYISYNTYPGWRFREAFREMMVYHTRGVEEPGKRVAEAAGFLNRLAACCPVESKTYGAALGEQIKTLEKRPASYLLHEHLETFNQPVYFRDFEAHLRRHGLKWFAEARVSEMCDIWLNPAAQEALAEWGKSPIEQQQYLDFLRNTRFRSSIFCRGELKPTEDPDHEVMRRFYLSSPAGTEAKVDLKSDQPVQYAIPGAVTFSVGSPMQKALLAVLSNFPERFSFEQLLDRCARKLGLGVNESERERLSRSLLALYLMEACELHSRPAPFVMTVSEKPRARKLARVQAKSGKSVTSHIHVPVTLSDFARQILGLLDGEHDREQVIGELEVLFERDGAVPSEELKGLPLEQRREALAKIVGVELEKIASAGLLEA